MGHYKKDLPNLEDEETMLQIRDLAGDLPLYLRALTKFRHLEGDALVSAFSDVDCGYSPASVIRDQFSDFLRKRVAEHRKDEGGLTRCVLQIFKFLQH